MKKLIVFFLFAFTISISYADTITYCARFMGTGKCASTKESACDSYLTQSQKDSGSKFLSVEGNRCKYFAFGSEVKLSSYICPDGQSYDGSSCVDGSGGSTPLNCKADEPYPVRSPDAKIFWHDETKSFYVATAAPNYACINNCEYTNLHEKYTQKCYLKKGTADIGYCNFAMYSTGASCSENTPSNGDAEVGDPLPTRPDENGGEMGGGDDDKGNENNNDNDQDKDKDKENENNNDNDKDKDKDQGGGGGGGGEGSDGDSGSSGGSGGTGTGGKDQGGKGEDGGNDGNNNDGTGTGGSGSGDGGSGTCDPSVEECGDGEGKASGTSCDEVLDCKGDVIQCAQLEKQKEIQCAQKELYELDKDKRQQLDKAVSENTKDIEGFGDKEAPAIDVSNLISKGSSWLPRNCPTPLNVSVYGQSLEFSFAPICEVAGWLSGIVVAIFSFLAIRIFGRDG